MSTERNTDPTASNPSSPWTAPSTSNPSSTSAPSAPLPFRRLTARSVLLSVLLGSEGAWLPTRLLVSTTALFGIAEGTTRTALSRMTATGEVEPTGDGYRIRSDDLLARQTRQEIGRAASRTDWDGSWHQVVVGLGERRSAAERAGVRATLGAARFGELREGVWLRPGNLTDAADLERLGDDVLIATVSDVSLDPRALVAALWDLDEWARTAHDLVGWMAPLLGRLERDDHGALADGFVVNAAVLRHLASDPLLPDELTPTYWPGAELRDTFDRFDAAFRRVILDHFRRHRG